MNAAEAAGLSAAGRLHLACEADLHRLPALLGLADQACAAAGADAAATYAVRLAVEEVIANIITHGYGPEGPGPIDLTLEWDANTIRVDIRDRAPRFDPDQVPAPDLEAPWESRNPGGIGWALINQLMSSVEHHFNPATGNQFTLTRTLAP